MIQNLSNFMNSPLAMVALLLWVLLFFLAIWQCRKWGKASRNENIIFKNHPAIPVKEYKLSEFGVPDGTVANIENRSQHKAGTKPINKLKANLGIKKQSGQLSNSPNVWDV